MASVFAYIFNHLLKNDRALNTSFVILWFIATRINSWLTRSVMKRIILNIHLCAGMIAALFLITLSFSGATIAFENELNRTFHPQLTNVKREGRPLDWDTVRDRVEQQSPGWKLIRFIFLTDLTVPLTFVYVLARPTAFATYTSTSTPAPYWAVQRMGTTGSCRFTIYT